jgi:hypothetical protein
LAKTALFSAGMLCGVAADALPHVNGRFCCRSFRTDCQLSPAVG